ncbi:uncharacterized protein EV420DRAFT_1767052 [Desarmillaria tabescens]|uniref:F-box domain-containing protein n=1 Tax=Armillaria tabescens TaxID=1929756 RepID=A0AA39JVG2_ARMTA|nr:uncharacterized protein EV420DRAFT_1767052 [Desarmillaria tabescens]KAK0449680.1 hypothetical protein EV420DRAFT_1767052 [Desarmillaria tabescens]
MLQAVISRYDNILSAEQQDAVLLRQANSGPLDERTTAILEEAELALHQLKEKRCFLHDAQRKHRAASSLSSIRTLPIEILTDIFCYAASDPIDILDTKHPAWAISKVCQLWRSIITTVCPEVWAKISVPRLRHDSAMVRKGALSSVLDTITTILSRSQTHMLHIAMDFDFFRGGATSLFQDNVWFHLALDAERWEKLHVSISPFDTRSMLDRLYGCLSSLKECTLYCYELGPRPELMVIAFDYTLAEEAI